MPILIMAISDPLLYIFKISTGYGFLTIIGITFFVWSGYLIATMIGWRLKKRYVFRINTLGIVTFAGVITVLVWDLWTDVGWWYFVNRDFMAVLQAQVVMTIVHVLSTLIFIPLFGSGYLLLTEHKVDVALKASAERPEKESMA